jgi:hypothetical protein
MRRCVSAHRHDNQQDQNNDGSNRTADQQHPTVRSAAKRVQETYAVSQDGPATHAPDHTAQPRETLTSDGSSERIGVSTQLPDDASRAAL